MRKLIGSYRIDATFQAFQEQQNWPERMYEQLEINQHNFWFEASNRSTKVDSRDSSKVKNPQKEEGLC